MSRVRGAITRTTRRESKKKREMQSADCRVQNGIEDFDSCASPLFSCKELVRLRVKESGGGRCRRAPPNAPPKALPGPGVPRTGTQKGGELT